MSQREEEQRTLNTLTSFDQILSASAPSSSVVSFVETPPDSERNQEYPTIQSAQSAQTHKSNLNSDYNISNNNESSADDYASTNNQNENHLIIDNDNGIDDDPLLVRGSLASIGDSKINAWIFRRKHFFILSSAGKPIYSRYGSESDATEIMGVFQTIISIFEQDKNDSDDDESGDTIESFASGTHLFVFKIMGPIYLVVVSATGESEIE
ncbi:Vacuolar fusion protein mon1, partial [Physocladia obscura]